MVFKFLGKASYTPLVKQIDCYNQKEKAMKKRLISLILSIICMFLMCTPIFAAQGNQITPQWENIKTLAATLTFNSNTGNVTVSVSGKSNVTNITATVNLYYKNTIGTWVEIEKDWSYNVNRQSLVILESFNATPGREYKIVVDGTVTMAGYVEDFSKTVISTCPSAQ